MTDDQVTALRAELANVRADYDGRIATLKKQQTDAKAKAKTIILRQKEASKQRIASLEDDGRLHAEELGQLKDMLRHAESEKTAMHEEAVVLKDRVRQLTAETTDSEQRLEEGQHQIEALKRELIDARQVAESKCEQLRTSLDDARQQLDDVRRARREDGDKTDGGDGAGDGNDMNNSQGDTGADDSVRLSDLLNDARRRADGLSEQLDAAKSTLDERTRDLESSLAEAKSRNSSLEQSISEAEARFEDTRAKLSNSEDALKREQDSAKTAAAAASTAARTAAEATMDGAPSKGSDEEKKVLDAKIAEMERLVMSKQAEVNKVREKARTYLKELNAEKRTLEEKKEEEVDALKKVLEQEQDKASAAEAKVNEVTKEVDSCLAVIREKQKAMQMLRMSITTEKNAAHEAKRETEQVRSDFTRYKERSRLVLQERESAAASSEADVEHATAGVREELERARQDSDELRRRVVELRKLETMVDEWRERTERAEAVADLLRKEETAGVAGTNYSQVDRLEEKVAQMEGQVSAARGAVEDAEARHASTKVRLEAAEKSLLSAEVRSKNVEAASTKTVQSMQVRLNELEKSLYKAREAAASAQRTAAAAAKAMTFSSTPDGVLMMGVKKSEDVGQGNENEDNGEYDLDVKMNGTRTSLAMAIEDHSARLGLSPRSRAMKGGRGDGAGRGEGDVNTGGIADVDVNARDQQIAVLTSQLAELGAMLDEMQNESQLREEQTEVLKTEVKNLDAKLEAAGKLQNGAPFSYLRTIVVRYLETEDVMLLPVICNVLSFSEEETARVKIGRGTQRTRSSGGGTSKNSGFFSLPFLGSQ